MRAHEGIKERSTTITTSINLGVIIVFCNFVLFLHKNLRLGEYISCFLTSLFAFSLFSWCLPLFAMLI